MPEVLFVRPDFGWGSLGGMLNQLAQREDGVILSEKVLARGNYEIGDKVRVRINVTDVTFVETDFTQGLGCVYDCPGDRTDRRDLGRAARWGVPGAEHG